MHAFAQQTPIYSLYTFNPFIVNPAYAGNNNYYQAHTNSRYQFLGIENAPVTTLLCFHGPHTTQPMGWGGTIFNDNQGALSKFGVYGSYSYTVPVKEDMNVSFGLQAGIINHTVDLTKVTFLHTEYSITEQSFNSLLPDATFGVFFDATQYYVAATLDQLFGNSIEIYNDTLVLSQTLNKLKNHASIMGGYIHHISPTIILEPYGSIRKTAQTPLQIEAGAKISYNNIIWFGSHIRTGGACIMYFNYNYRDLLSFAYAYDITYSAIRKESFGSHEILLGFRFNTIK